MPANVRKCHGCGCTEERACVISVSIASADGTAAVVLTRGCSWSQSDPQYCTGCEAPDRATAIDILHDLFPEEFHENQRRALEAAAAR
jgi:hypothetical protein